ncbi:hypothetical protein LINPERPRIM_LOCUS26453 [Linum perenne]
MIAFPSHPSSYQQPSICSWLLIHQTKTTQHFLPALRLTSAGRSPASTKKLRRWNEIDELGLVFPMSITLCAIHE